MPCACTEKTQYEVIDSTGNRLFGPTPYKTTADAMAQRHPGATVVPSEKGK
jgi:hypothetical protein